MADNKNEASFSKEFNMPTSFLNPNALANEYYNYEKLESMAKWLQTKTDIKPLVGIICGSGLGNIGELVENKTVLSYNDIPYFPRSTVEGHKGNLLFGTLSGVPVVAMQGRFHPYEGYCAAVCTVPIKVFKFLGVKLMILTNAAGGLNRNYNVGDLMLIKDHLSFPLLTLNHPLVGHNDNRFGPRFLPINLLYDVDMRNLLKQVADENKLHVHEGNYGVVGGPTYETVSDCKLYLNNGADVVGMSTAHEAVVAKYVGMKVLALSIVTDMAELEFDRPCASDHAEICKVAARKAKDVEVLVQSLLKKVSDKQSLLD